MVSHLRGEALRWFSEAEWDFDTAQILHREKRYNAAVFYAHQAAEKACRALLYSVNEAARGHSIRMLLEHYMERCKVQIREELLVHARELDRHYIPSRYPNAHPAGTPHEAYDKETSRRALEAAKAILDFVQDLL